jgi:pimeloyl-ACP methyl ester carboxylesterase
MIEVREVDVNLGARCRRVMITLALGGLVYQSAVSAFGTGPSDAGSSPSAIVADGAADGCPYTTTDYIPPANTRYETEKFNTPEGGFYYHYDFINAGKLVVLVAGFPDPHYFDALRALLLEANYRVLILDLPGKEHTRLSARPTAEFIVKQYQQLWQTRDLHRGGKALIDESEPLIVGTSIGGPVAALLSARWASQSPKLALVSALGLPPDPDWPFLIKLGRVPVLSELLAPFLFRRQVEARWRSVELICANHFPQLFERQDLEFWGGFARINYLELSRALALTDQTPVYQQIANTIPVLLAYGEKDPFREQCKKIKGTIRGPVERRLIERSAHIAFIEQPAETFDALDAFLKARPQPVGDPSFCSAD